MRRWRRKKNIKKDIKINKNIFLYFYLFLPIFPSAACRNKLLTFNSNDMKKILIWALPLLMGSVCHAEDITIQYNGSTAKVQQKAKDSVNVTVKGANVHIESQYTSHKLTVLLSGKSDDGQLVLKTAGKAKVTLNKLNLTSQEGAPLDLRNKKKVEIIAADGTENTLTITACNDTANNKAAAIWSKDKILLSGKGTLNVIATGDGCRGIKAKKDITIEDLTLNVTTSGNHLGEKPYSFGDFGGFGGGEMPDFGGISVPEVGGFPPTILKVASEVSQALVVKPTTAHVKVDLAAFPTSEASVVFQALAVKPTTAHVRVDLAASPTSEASEVFQALVVKPMTAHVKVVLVASQTSVVSVVSVLPMKTAKMVRKAEAWASEASTSMSHPLRVLHRREKSLSTVAR